MKYSVIIRTIGKAGEKYRKLLESIQKSTIQPQEIIVVLPDGFEIPKEQIGYERFIFCKKGMVNQRVVGINACKTDYALILDDDISYDTDFVEKVSAPVVSGAYGLSSGPLIEFFPKPGIQAFVAWFFGSACPTVFHKDRYNTLLKTTGYSYNRKLKYNTGKLYETQSAPWTCFFADIKKLRSIHFEDELWLDMHGYSSHDDTAMFYKAWLCGVKTVIVADAHYQHLDAGTSRSGIKTKRYLSGGFNSYVLWKRLICYQANPLREKLYYIPFRYHELVCKLYYRIKLGKEASSAFQSGYTMARDWVKSDEYLNLPPVKY